MSALSPVTAEENTEVDAALDAVIARLNAQREREHETGEVA